MAQKRLTPNQIVGYNLGRARRMRGWRQEDAAKRLEPYLGERWSKASFSAAERSIAHPDRVKQFTADDLLAFATVFDLPVSYFFTPPPDAERIGAPSARQTVTRDQLMKLAPFPREHVEVLAREAAERLREIGEAAGIKITIHEPEGQR